MANLDSMLKHRDITLPTKVRLVKAKVFPVVVYGCELDHKENWAAKNWCFWTVVLEKTLQSPLDCKEIKLVNPKRNQSWIFIGRTDAEAETPILWPLDTKKWLIWKDPDAGKDWRWEEKGITEVGWHHQRDGHKFEQDPGVGDGQGPLASMGSQRVRHNWATELNWEKTLMVMKEGLSSPSAPPLPPALQRDRDVLSSQRAGCLFTLLSDGSLTASECNRKQTRAAWLQGLDLPTWSLLSSEPLC